MALRIAQPDGAHRWSPILRSSFAALPAPQRRFCGSVHPDQSDSAVIGHQWCRHSPSGSPWHGYGSPTEPQRPPVMPARRMPGRQRQAPSSQRAPLRVPCVIPEGLIQLARHARSISRCSARKLFAASLSTNERSASQATARRSARRFENSYQSVSRLGSSS